VSLEIGRVDHNSLSLRCFRHSQAFHHLEKDALVTPAFPPGIKRLGGAVFLRRIAPPETVAVHEYDPAQETPIIDALAAVALGGNRAEDEPLAPPSAQTNYSSVRLLYARLDHSRRCKSMGPDLKLCRLGGRYGAENVGAS